MTNTATLGRSQAIVDLIVFAAVFWSIWSLRFAGITFIGAWTMGAGILLVLWLQHRRGRTVRELGITRIPSARTLVSGTLQAAFYIGVTMLVVGGVAALLLGRPSESAAITQQPGGFWFFLLDVTLVTWVLIGFGEEFVFRGFVLNRLLALTGETRNGRLVAALLQAVWFGSGHASQGLSGMILTGAIGFVLALLFLYRTGRSLWPLIVAHAGIDTVALTAAWIVNH